MTEPAFATVSYNEQDQQVSWRGVIMDDDDDFDAFLTDGVASIRAGQTVGY
jgi:hypothetical protein